MKRGGLSRWRIDPKRDEFTSPIQRVCERLGVGFTDLALAAGMSQAMISHMHRGRRKLPPPLAHYLSGLGIDVEALAREQEAYIEQTRAALRTRLRAEQEE